MSSAEARTVTAGPPGCRGGGSAATRRAPWPAGRSGAWAATPSPRMPSTTKFRARRFGRTCRTTVKLGGLRAAVRGTGRRSASCASQRQASSVRTQTPTLALPPLSPLRAPATRPRGARRVGAGGQRFGQRAVRRQRLVEYARCPWAGAHGHPVARRGSTATWATSPWRDVRSLEDPVGRALPGRRRDMEAGVAAERQLDGGAAERPADRAPGPGPGRRAAAARWRVSSVSASGVVGAGQVPAHLGGRRLAESAASIWSRTSAALASMSRPVRTKTTSLRKPPSRLSPTLRVGGGASPRTPEIRTRSGPSWVSRTVSRRAVTSGPGVPGAAGLVQQLGGDRADVDDAAGAGVLGDDGRCRPRGSRRAGSRGGGRRRLARRRSSCRRWPGCRTPGRARRRRRPRARRRSSRSPAEVGGGGPGDERGVGDPAGDDDVGARAQTGGDAAPPR